ncbi:TPA: NAD(+)/NADH kinase [Candidatus Geothermarchaeota archaeon]|nr:NAD(+)/NADH kinase [Candidatus Geothermarchaeota archaeon]HIQ12935.1 NAD(+)/NADH kinase [Thermoprotei archaeon]
MKTRSNLIKGVTIYIPDKNENIVNVLNGLIERLDQENVKIYDIIKIKEVFDDINLLSGQIPQLESRGDLAIAIGGDGTVLKTLLMVRDKEMPILAIGLGELNFMSSTDKTSYLEDLDKLFQGRFYIRSEMRLDVKVSDTELEIPPILNEVLYHSSKIGKTLLPIVKIRMRNYVEYLWSVKSDGVLVSTPIGSTAYSYAAGGPILDTDLEAIVITPLTPTTKIPSYVVNPDTKIFLTAERLRSNPSIVLDGQVIIDLDWTQEVEVSKSSKPAHIITFQKNTNMIRMKRVAERYGGVRE